jgi:hypothetical protein
MKVTLNLFFVVFSALLLVILHQISFETMNVPLEKNSCFYFQIFNKPCPGCGMTRATYFLLHFDIRKAIYYNPSVLFIPILIMSEVICFLCKFNRNKLFNIYLIFTISLFLIYLYRSF